MIGWTVKNLGSVAHREKLVLRVRCKILRFATSLREVGMYRRKWCYCLEIFRASLVISHRPCATFTPPHLPTGPARPAHKLSFTLYHLRYPSNVFRPPRIPYCSGNKHRFRFFSSTSGKLSSQNDLRGSVAQPRRTSSRELVYVKFSCSIRSPMATSTPVFGPT